MTEKSEAIRMKNHLTPGTPSTYLITVDWCILKPPLRASSISTTGERVRNANYWMPLQTYWIKFWGWGPAILCFSKCSRWFWWGLKSLWINAFGTMYVSIEFPCTADLSLSASQEHHSIKSSTSQFYLYWIIPISIKMCCLFPPFLLSVTTHFSIPLQQDPKEEAVTPWCHFPLIFSNPLQSGFSVALNLWPYIVNSQPLPYLTYKWHVISLIHFFHLYSSMAHTLLWFSSYFTGCSYLVSLVGSSSGFCPLDARVIQGFSPSPTLEFIQSKGFKHHPCANYSQM